MSKEGIHEEGNGIAYLHSSLDDIQKRSLVYQFDKYDIRNQEKDYKSFEQSYEGESIQRRLSAYL